MHRLLKPVIKIFTHDCAKQNDRVQFHNHQVARIISVQSADIVLLSIVRAVSATEVSDPHTGKGICFKMSQKKNGQVSSLLLGLRETERYKC